MSDHTAPTYELSDAGPAERGRARWWGRWRARLAPRPATPCGCRNAFGEHPHRAEEIALDVRSLPLAGQISRTSIAAEALPPGYRVRHVNTHVPWPLFSHLEARGCTYRLVGQQGNEVHLLVWPRG